MLRSGAAYVRPAAEFDIATRLRTPFRDTCGSSQTMIRGPYIFIRAMNKGPRNAFQLSVRSRVPEHLSCSTVPPHGHNDLPRSSLQLLTVIPQHDTLLVQAQCLIHASRISYKNHIITIPQSRPGGIEGKRQWAATILSVRVERPQSQVTSW